MRRADRKITDIDDILAILKECEVIRLGMIHGREPYIIPMNFAFEYIGGALDLFVHSAVSGRKMEAVSQNPRVCFETDRLFRIEGDGDACGWTALYESVVGYGRVDILEDIREKEAVLELLTRRYGFDGEFHASGEMLVHTAVIKISVESVTGKANRRK